MQALAYNFFRQKSTTSDEFYLRLVGLFSFASAFPDRHKML